MSTRGWIIIVFLALALSATLTTCGFERIDAGHIGIEVDLYGNNKGVQDVHATTGAVWYNRWTTEIYEFPTFVQHKVWTVKKTEDSPINEQFTITTKDGMALSFDVGFDYQVKPERGVAIFVKYRKDLPQITNEFLRTAVRNAYNDVGNSYEAAKLVSQRAEYERIVRDTLESRIGVDFYTNQCAIVGKIVMPPELENAINAKIKAVEDAQRVENELRETIAEAEKKIERAKGIKESKKIRADGERYAYEQRKAELTPLLVKQQWIEKWNGQLPSTIAGGGQDLLLNIK